MKKLIKSLETLGILAAFLAIAPIQSCKQTTNLEGRINNPEKKRYTRLHPLDRPSKQDIEDYIELYGKPSYINEIYFARHGLIEKLSTVNTEKFLIIHILEEFYEKNKRFPFSLEEIPENFRSSWKEWPPQDVTQEFFVENEKLIHPLLNYETIDGQFFKVWWYGPDRDNNSGELEYNFQKNGLFSRGDIILKGNYEDLKSKLEQIAKIEAEKEKKKCLIVAMGKDTEAIEISERLYKEGIKNYIIFGKVIRPEPMEHAKSYAKFNNFPYIIFLEQDNNRYKFIDMKKGKEEILKEREIFNRVR